MTKDRVRSLGAIMAMVLAGCTTQKVDRDLTNASAGMSERELASSRSPHADWEPEDYFVTRWEVSADSNGLLVIPAAGSEGFDYDVDWDGDGVFDAVGVTHSAYNYYGRGGEVTVAIRGTFPHMTFIPSEACEVHMEAEDPVLPFPEDPIASDQLGCNRGALRAVERWGAIEWRSMFRMFNGVRLEGLPAEPPDLSRVEDMSLMFENATYSGEALEGWDVSGVTSMDGIFSETMGMTTEPGWWVERGRP